MSSAILLLLELFFSPLLLIFLFVCLFVCLFQDAPASLLTSAKKKITNVGIFLKVGSSVLSAFTLKLLDVCATYASITEIHAIVIITCINFLLLTKDEEDEVENQQENGEVL